MIIISARKSERERIGYSTRERIAQSKQTATHSAFTQSAEGHDSSDGCQRKRRKRDAGFLCMNKGWGKERRTFIISLGGKLDDDIQSSGACNGRTSESECWVTTPGSGIMRSFPVIDAVMQETRQGKDGERKDASPQNPLLLLVYQMRDDAFQRISLSVIRKRPGT